MDRFQDKPFVYLAMQLTDGGTSGVLGYTLNAGRMIREAVRLFAEGYPTYVPCLDVLVLFMAGGTDTHVEMHDIYDNSLAILRKCDVVYIPSDQPVTHGVGAEHNEAQRLHIPIVRYRAELARMRLVDGKWRLEAP